MPPNFADQVIQRQQAQIQVLIDSSDSQVATTALQATSLRGFVMSTQKARQLGEQLPRVPARDPAGRPALPVEIRARLLINPDLESSHFFVPGLVGIILQLVTLLLISFAIVRERERGTLEQLFVTPVGKAGILLGRLRPYAVLGFIDKLVVLAFAIPVTYFVEILRGIFLRGADFIDLLPHTAGLTVCCIVIVGLSLVRFRRQLT
jgi:ABC-type multidrug transport system permease subunit